MAEEAMECCISVDNQAALNAEGNDSGEEILFDEITGHVEELSLEKENGEEISFDEIIGHIEDLLLEEGFHDVQHKFLEEYWNIFEPVEENKFIYMDIFDEYSKAIENYIVDYLKEKIPHFNINILLRQLTNRPNDLEGEVFEVLSSFTDFFAFKEMFLDYRAVKEGQVQDLSSGISITCLKPIDTNENESPR